MNEYNSKEEVIIIKGVLLHLQKSCELHDDSALDEYEMFIDMLVDKVKILENSI